MAEWMALWLPAAISFAGAVSGFAVWSRPMALKIWALAVSLATLAALATAPAGTIVGWPLPAAVVATME